MVPLPSCNAARSCVHYSLTDRSGEGIRDDSDKAARNRVHTAVGKDLLSGGSQRSAFPFLTRLD